jgi:hypothetical protein
MSYTTLAFSKKNNNLCKQNSSAQEFNSIAPQIFQTANFEMRYDDRNSYSK